MYPIVNPASPKKKKEQEESVEWKGVEDNQELVIGLTCKETGGQDEDGDEDDGGGVGRLAQLVSDSVGDRLALLQVRKRSARLILMADGGCTGAIDKLGDAQQADSQQLEWSRTKRFVGGSMDKGRPLYGWLISELIVCF
jgi:hypothetical protein